MKTYKGDQAIATCVDGHKVFIKLQTVGFNYAVVTVHVYHRKGQQVSIKFKPNDNFSFRSEDWDTPSEYTCIEVNTRPYNHWQELLEDVLNHIAEVNVFIDFSVEDRVSYELFNVLPC